MLFRSGHRATPLPGNSLHVRSGFPPPACFPEPAPGPEAATGSCWRGTQSGGDPRTRDTQPGSERGDRKAAGPQGQTPAGRESARAGSTHKWALRPQAPQTEVTEQTHPRGTGGPPLCPGRAPLVSGPDLTHHPGPRVPQPEARTHLQGHTPLQPGHCAHHHPEETPGGLLFSAQSSPHVSPRPGRSAVASASRPPQWGTPLRQCPALAPNAGICSRRWMPAVCPWAAVPARELDVCSGHGPWPPRPPPVTLCRAPPPGPCASLLQRADGTVPAHGAALRLQEEHRQAHRHRKHRV